MKRKLQLNPLKLNIDIFMGRKKWLEILVFFTLIGCNETDYNEKTIIFNNVSNFNFTEKQSFEIDNTKDTILLTGESTKLIIKANTFKAEYSSIILKISEYYSFNNFIFSGLYTLSDSNLIETGGMFNILAYADSLSIDINADSYIEVIPSSKKKKGMKLFNGIEVDERINWIENRRTVGIAYSEGMDSIIKVMNRMSRETNILRISELGWINADRFIEFEEKIDLFIDVPLSQNGIVFSLIFYNYNSILPGVLNKNNQLVFRGIPKGEKVTLLGLGGHDETLYYNSLDLITDTKIRKFPKLISTSKKKLESILTDKFGKDLDNRPKPNFTFAQ